MAILDKEVHKYPILRRGIDPKKDEGGGFRCVVEMPEHATILSYGFDKFGDVCCWAQINLFPEISVVKRKSTRTFYVVMTGEPHSHNGYRATIHTPLNDFIVHIYEGAKVTNA